MCQVSTGSGEEDFQVEDVYIHVVKAFHLINLKFLRPTMNSLWKVILKLSSEQKDFLKMSMYFPYLATIIPLKRAWPFEHLKKLNLNLI